MTTQADLAARVPDREKRLEAARLYAATTAADEARGSDPAFEALDEKYQPQFDALRDEYRTRHDEINAAKSAEAERLDLNVAAVAAQKAHDDFDAPALQLNEDGEVETCALTGLPLFEDDAVLEDTTTGEKVLKVLLGVPLDEGDLSFALDEPQQAAA
jgi:hypothetical protein